MHQQPCKNKRSFIALNKRFRFTILNGASYKVGRVFLIIVVSILPHAEIGRNDHREDFPI